MQHKRDAHAKVLVLVQVDRPQTCLSHCGRASDMAPGSVIRMAHPECKPSILCESHVLTM